jgi:hypothetical protein
MQFFYSDFIKSLKRKTHNRQFFLDSESILTPQPVGISKFKYPPDIGLFTTRISTPRYTP